MEHHYVAAGLEGLPTFVGQTRGDIWVNAHGSGIGSRLAGPPGAVVALKSIAKVEMLHAQSSANRITALGGTPTITPSDRCKASSVREMLELDVDAESEAVAMYVESIELCRRASDEESAALFERILADERAHLATFRDLLTSRS
jgi:bacterioferritin